MKPYCHSDMKPMKSPLTMVTEGTIPYSNSLTFGLSYPQPRDAIASKNWSKRLWSKTN